MSSGRGAATHTAATGSPPNPTRAGCRHGAPVAGTGQHTLARVPALDGLRGLAVLAVVTYHVVVLYRIDLPALHGWLGVDVFFVLSGFLITTLLMTELQRTGRIALGRFWLRRAARLYPALLVLVAGCLVLAQLGYTTTTAPAGMLAMTYLTDFYRAAGRGSAGDVGHTWSLAVEEQFYLAWPLAVMLLRTRRRIVVITSAAAALSFGLLLMLAVPRAHDLRAYNAPDTRAWELLAGCLLALALHRRTQRGRTLPRRLGTAVSVPAVLLALVPLAVNLIWPLQALSVTLATVATLTSIQAGAWPARLLALVPLAWIGRISYGVYLYHIPVARVLTPRLPLPGPFVVVGDILVTLICAWLSFRFLEEPVRRSVAALQARRQEPRLTPRPGRRVRRAEGGVTKAAGGLTVGVQHVGRPRRLDLDVDRVTQDSQSR
jgi:peptidoglycan/LPS O-acetylase OafA/YrhL